MTMTNVSRPCAAPAPECQHRGRAWLGALGLALGLSLLSAPAWAQTWRVDLLVFRYLRPISEQGTPPAPPELSGAIDLTDTAALRLAGITLLPDEAFALHDHWKRLRQSAQFRPLIRLAWTQQDPPPRNGPRLRLTAGETMTVSDAYGLGAREMHEIDGSVALHLGRFLHLETDMIYTTPEPPAQSWKLSSNRRMRSDELHHFDSPRLAAIVRVVRWDPQP